METLADAEALKLSAGAGESKSVESADLNEDDGEGVAEMDEAELGEEDDTEDEEEEEEGRVFSVGEFVWGKIKHHPWWPGQIYDASDASELALKHKPKDKDLYLVAYFGDGTFSWCSGAQLKSFDENFELLSRQTSLKSFVYAVEDALNVIGELVVLEMSCNCVERAGCVRPVAENAGVRKGVLVPMVGVESLAVARFDAAVIVASVRNAAQSISVKNGLELTMLKSKLLVFYRSKGYSCLPKYQFPMCIVGLEDINIAGNIGMVDGLLTNEDSHTPLASSSEKAHGLQEDKLYGRRKQKSLADIIREETDTDVQNGKDDEETPPKRQGTRRRKRAGQTESEEKGGQSSLSKGKKKVKSSREANSNKDIKFRSAGDAETFNVDDNDRPDNVVVDVAVRSKGKKRIAATTDGKDGTAAKSRDKKRNKYSLKPMASIKHVGFEPVVLELHTDTRVGERMSKAAKLIIESPPTKKHCSSIDPKETEKLSVKNSAAVSPLHDRPFGTKFGDLSSSKSSNYEMDEEYDEDDDGRPMSAILFLTFSDGVPLPTKADLLAKYRQFGSLNEEETDVVPNSLCAQVVFIKKSEGEHAFDEMVKMNSGESGVQYRIRYVSRVSKVCELDENAPPKTSPHSDKANTDVHPVSVSYVKRKFETLISQLNDTEGETLPSELKKELHSQLTNLLEKLSSDL